MIDGYFKEYQDKFWNKIGYLFASLGFTANSVTLLGLFLQAINALYYMYHQNHFWFGIAVALIEFLDDVDGAIARVTKTCTKYGSYLDAVTDRYKDSAILFSIAFVTGYWVLCFIAVSGSLITSYNKARAGMELPVKNENWPDFFERLERMIAICAGLILTSFFPQNLFWGHSLLWMALIVLAVCTHISAWQRFWRARKLLINHTQ
ncbi:MAG: CDP-alcohol phosphatidyltransferase family protein [Candidatus Brocadiae bacterium]|nr:CDP-alcohol phosphatidyltransferase family protein [Candidatus Brocadiia bacterium]